MKLFTLSDGACPLAVFIGFLGPLLGIALGFDAINSEQNKGTLSRLMSQPIYRDYIINAKKFGRVVGDRNLAFRAGFLVMGFGLVFIGIPPTVEEFLRVVIFPVAIAGLYRAFGSTYRSPFLLF